MNRLEQYILDNNRVWPFPTYEAAAISDRGFIENSVTKDEFNKRIAEENRPSFEDHPDAKCFVCNADGLWNKNTATHKVRKTGSVWTPIDNIPYAWVQLQKGNPIGGWKESLMIRPEQKAFTKADLKDGMWVTYRDGRERLLLGERLFEKKVNGSLWISNKLENYLDGLSTTRDSLQPVDIVKVEYMGELIWERPAPKPAPKPAPTEREIFISKFNKYVPGFFSDEYINEIYNKGFRYMGELYE